jgi:hypothetical protein
MMGSQIHSLRRVRTCPFSLWVAVYLGGIFVGDLLLSRIADFSGVSWLGWPLLVVGMATAGAAVLVERSYQQAQDCDWLPDGRGLRITLYVLSFVVGVFVIQPGLSMAPDVSIIFRAIAGVSLAALTALMILHLRTHEEGSDAGRGAVLRGISVLPVVALGLVLIGIVIVALLEVLSTR